MGEQMGNRATTMQVQRSQAQLLASRPTHGVNDRGQQLISRNLLDSLLKGIAPDYRAAAAELCAACGYDTNQPHAFYDVVVMSRLAKDLGRLLCPGAGVVEQNYTLGWAIAEGYRETITGRLMVARRGPMPIVGSINYYIAQFAHGLPTLRFVANQLDTRSCEVLVTGLALHPAVLQGVIVRMLELVGCQQPACEYRESGNDDYCYLVSWAAVGPTARGYLSQATKKCPFAHFVGCTRTDT